MRRDFVDAGRRVHRNGVRLTPQRDASTGLERGVGIGQQAARGLGDEEGVAELAGGLLDAGRNVYRVADDRELQPAASPDRARDDWTRVYAHSDMQATVITTLYLLHDLA